MINLVEKKENCCGCALCYNVCPKHAISMVEDEFGYVYPNIDEEKCINCGLCKMRCTYQNKDKKLNMPIQVFAACAKDKEILKNSASGGVFSSIAKEFLKQGGVVYGSSMIIKKGESIVKHTRVDNVDELYMLQGSKYVQSNIKETYFQIKNDLYNGKKVLFSGTPCQVASVKEFMNDKNLLTIDIICHGVPNNKMFNDYLQVIEKKERDNIKEFKFRDKTKGWGLFASYTFNNSNKKIIKPAYELSYYQLFLDSKIYRKNCYNCPYAKESRCSDITIGDYWGFKQEYPNIADKFNDKDGISCILINTEIGKKYIEEYKDELDLIDSDIQKVSRHNKQLKKPSEYPYDREKILLLYNRYGFERLEKNYKIRNFIKNFIKKIRDIL